MSTEFTDNADAAPAVVPFAQALISANQWVSASLLHLMRERGHGDLNGSHLTFFSHLNCGVTGASEVARRMGMTRQAVYKITKELQRIGAVTLELDSDDKRQKVIRMTKRGEQIAMDAVAAMSKIEAHLREMLGEKSFKAMSRIIQEDWGPPLSAAANNQP